MGRVRLLLALILLTFAVQANSAETVGGTVFDRAGHPVPGVQVSLVEFGQSAYTTNDGRFYFWQVPDGLYTVEVYWGNDLVYRQQHQINEGVDLTINL